jgi:hypothetical protein
VGHPHPGFQHHATEVSTCLNTVEQFNHSPNLLKMEKAGVNKTFHVYFFGGLECLATSSPMSPIIFLEMSGFEPRELQYQAVLIKLTS